MANITRFDPFGDLARFDAFRDLEDFFWRPPSLRSLWRALPQEPEIRLDVAEDDTAYHVKVDVPGVKKEDIKVSIDGNRLGSALRSRRKRRKRKAKPSYAASATTANSSAASRSVMTSTRPRPRRNTRTACCSSRFPRKRRRALSS
jgi:HSP20 family molecular chaperone IbpA